MRIDRDREFLSDLRGQLGYLVDRGEAEWILILQQDLADVEDLLRSFPDAGREVLIGRGAPVRRLRLHRAPYVVWYQVSARGRRVVLLRLFHVRQKTPL
jgi:plasmid stabilization system protein ParE